MFLPCHKCGGASHPALAHFTGLTEPHCKECAGAIFAKQQEAEHGQKRLVAYLTAAIWLLACEYTQERRDESTLRFPLKDQLPLAHR